MLVTVTGREQDAPREGCQAPQLGHQGLGLRPEAAGRGGLLCPGAPGGPGGCCAAPTSSSRPLGDGGCEIWLLDG